MAWPLPSGLRVLAYSTSAAIAASTIASGISGKAHRVAAVLVHRPPQDAVPRLLGLVLQGFADLAHGLDLGLDVAGTALIHRFPPVAPARPSPGPAASAGMPSLTEARHLAGTPRSRVPLPCRPQSGAG